MKDQVVAHNFRQATLDRIALANSILEEYADQGYVLTVRQVYYQLVARDHIDNNIREYKRLVSLLTKGREAGLIDWRHLEDRARRSYILEHFTDPSEFAQVTHHWFRVDHWKGQENYVMVMLEKDALAGILLPVCEELDVRLAPNRGYASASVMYDHSIRVWNAHNEHGKKIHVLYLGDHDPSGMDMDQDIQGRLKTYSGFQVPIRFRRLALTMSQISEYDPPPDPAKPTDSRTPKYVYEHGYDCWELDALQPDVLTALVRDAVLALRDGDAYEQVMEKEKAMIEALKDGMASFADDYDNGEYDPDPDDDDYSGHDADSDS